MILSTKICQSRILRNGFTLLELFIVIAIISILIGMLLPAVRTVREPARRSRCQNNQKQLVLACLNFEATHLKFPAMRGAMQNGTLVSDGNAPELSGLVSLLPFLEENRLYEQIAEANTLDDKAFPAWGPPTTDTSYPPWQQQIASLECPSSPNGSELKFGVTNYAFSMGDLARDLLDPNHLRGIFGGNLTCTIQDIADGTSNTIAIAEMGGSSGRWIETNYAIDQTEEILDNPNLLLKLIDKDGKSFLESTKLGEPKRGGHWAFGEPCVNGFNTILPPNSPSAKVADSADGIFSAGSFHGGTVVVAYADGSTHSIPTEIECGDSSAATPLRAADPTSPAASPYGIWGALGTINGGEVIDSFHF